MCNKRFGKKSNNKYLVTRFFHQEKYIFWILASIKVGYFSIQIIYIRFCNTCSSKKQLTLAPSFSPLTMIPVSSANFLFIIPIKHMLTEIPVAAISMSKLTIRSPVLKFNSVNFLNLETFRLTFQRRIFRLDSTQKRRIDSDRWEREWLRCRRRRIYHVLKIMNS